MEKSTNRKSQRSNLIKKIKNLKLKNQNVLNQIKKEQENLKQNQKKALNKE